MRKFSSYGIINKEANYFVPRSGLFQKAYIYLIGENPDSEGHYITVWGPRQSGKSSLLRDIYWKLEQDNRFSAVNISIQNLLGVKDSLTCMNSIADKINLVSGLELPRINNKSDFETLFTAHHLSKPLILIIDEFDSLEENVINDIVAAFRNIHNIRKTSRELSRSKPYLLHGLALIGVRSVLGIENKSGSPFNVQRSLQVCHLTKTEVREMYRWYEEETGQQVHQEVTDRIFEVTRGQPGLVSWFGELMTEKYNSEPARPLQLKHFNYVYNRAIRVETDSNSLNIISKAKLPPYRQTVLELFRIDEKIEFRFENPELNFLYMHGVTDYREDEAGLYYAIFSCQYIQEKLFNYFSGELVKHSRYLLADPLTDLTTVINDSGIDVETLLGLYQAYFNKNKDELLRYAQRRVDLSVMEVVYHFQLYSWLNSLLRSFDAIVLPEFPTGNGKIDLLIRHRSGVYGLELKSFSHLGHLKQSIEQASGYGKSPGLEQIILVVFIDRPLPDEIKAAYGKPFVFSGRTTVKVFFLETD